MIIIIIIIIKTIFIHAYPFSNSWSPRGAWHVQHGGPSLGFTYLWTCLINFQHFALPSYIFTL